VSIVTTNADPGRARQLLRARIRQIARESGGIVALARRAGLSASTVAQYTTDKPGRASEPGAIAVAKLARAAEVRVEWLVSGDGPKAEADARGSKADLALLRLVIEGVEEGLARARRTMPAAKKAELVARFYELFAGEPRKPDLNKVIALVKAAA
jgi:transcriptional regulator with XRE-family HTH domain